MNFDKYKNTLEYTPEGVTGEALKKWRNGYNNRTAQLEEEFKADLFYDLSIENNPKRYKLYRIARDMGHSSGYSEVYNYACELVELIED